MSLDTAPVSAPATGHRPAAELEHDCDPRTTSAGATARASSNRYVGIDAARGLALLGMVAVHTISAANADGDQTLAWQLFSGRSAALFAILGGAGIAFMTGRTRRPHGVQWAQRAVTPIVRGLLIAATGLALGYAVAADDAFVILPYLGLMFVASSLLLPLRPRTLIGLGLGWAVVSPMLSHLLRAPDVPALPTNLTFTDLMAAPGATATTLLLTGAFPVLTWMSYIALGLGIGRSALASRTVIARLVGGGALLVLLSEGLAWLFVTTGLRDRLAADVVGHTSLDAFTDYLVWGGDGVLPADSPWWLAVNAPHTGTPLDLISTAGIALVTIGLCQALAMAVAPRMLRVLSAPGSMTLTLYTMHVLLIAPLSFLPDLVAFVAHMILLTVFALMWSARFSKGPLEWLMAEITHAVEPGRRNRRAAVGAAVA